MVLGRTGRNFAAGMSGGVAYVFDPDDVFAAKVNFEMVDLEKLSVSDEGELSGILRRHVEETGSALARRILDDWGTSKALFVKVMPRDYKRVLEVMEAARAEGLDEQQTLDKVMEAARG